jgi:hypothetical protein
MIDLSTIKVGDVVRVLPFKTETTNGVDLTEAMLRYVGTLGIVKRVGEGWVSLKDNTYYFPPKVLERVTDANIYIIVRSEAIIKAKPANCNGFFTFADPKWGAVLGDWYDTSAAYVGESCERTLKEDMFGVGNAGDKVKVSKIYGHYYLDEKYLPFYGQIDNKLEEDK